MVLDDFLQLNSEDLITCLEGYQQDLVRALIAASNDDYNMAADKWLSASPSNTAQFGGDHKQSSVFREKVFEELEKFICGCDDGRYENAREELDKQGDVTKEVIISVMSAAIGSVIGVAGAFIAPIIVLLLLALGAIVKNAWCETRNALKAQAIENTGTASGPKND